MYISYLKNLKRKHWLVLEKQNTNWSVEHDRQLVVDEKCELMRIK